MRKQKTVYAPRESFELLSPEEQRTVSDLVRKGIVVLVDRQRAPA